MPKTFLKKTAGWSEIKSIFVKKTTGWTEVKNVFLKKTTGWVKVFTKLSLPDTTTSPSIRTTNTSGTGTIYDGPVATSPQFLNEDLFGKDGTYTNYTSIFGRKFTYGDTASSLTRTTIVNDDRFTSAGGVTVADRTALDGKYLFYELTVQNGSASNEIYPISSAIKMIKSQPKLGSFSTTLTGQPSPNSVLTFSYNLENYYYNRLEQANSKVRWWRSTNTTASGTLLKEETLTDTVTSSSSSSLSGSSSYTIHGSNDNGSYIVVEIVGVSSWTVHNSYTNGYQVVSRNVGPVSAEYRFDFGNILYVSSNGHIGLDSGSSSYTSMSAGRNISIFVKDLEQYYLAEYSNESVYYLYFRSYLLNTAASAANALDYQIKFYKDTAINYCDVYIVRKGSNVSFSADIAPGYYQAGTTGYAGMLGPYVIAAGTVFRVYFGGTAATTSGISWTSVSDNLWDVIQTWPYPDGADDTFTAVTSATNQQAPVPSNTTAPTLTTDTENFSAGSTITINTGTWTNASSYSYELLYSSTTPVADTSSVKTLVNTNQYVVKNTDATSPSYYFRGRVTAYAGTDQTGNSTSALTTTSSRSTLNPTTTISVATATANGFTISGTAGPLSGFGTAYVSVSSIAIYNSAQSLLSTITTGLPAVDGTDGTWSYAWTGGSANTTYYAKVTVKATDSAETTFTTGFSDSIKTTTATTAPTSLTATTNNNTKITLEWSGGAGTSYEFFQTTGSATVPSTTASFTTTNTSSYDWSDGTRGTTYYFFVRAATGTTKSAWYPAAAPGVQGKEPLYAPATPTITNSAKSSNSLSWHWTQPTPSATQDEPTSWDYKITDSATAPTTLLTNTTTRPTAASPVVTSSLTADTTYYMHVRAKNGDATGSWTNLSAKTNTAPTTPGAVQNLSSTAITGGARISWTAPASDGGSPITKYQIKRDTFSYFDNVPATALSYDYTLSAGTYTIYVRAVNAVGNGTETSISVTVAAPFTTPSWNGTMPAWANTGANGSNFRRLSTSLQYGWNNGTFSFSGSTTDTKGWDFYASGTQPATTTTVRTPTHTRAYSTTTSGTQIYTTSFIYRVNPDYSADPVYGSIRPYQYGTDGNKYVRGTQPNGTWSVSI